MRRRAALALLVLRGSPGAAEAATRGGPAVVDVTTGPTQAADDSCSPGVHELTLDNGQAARMHVTPGAGTRALDRRPARRRRDAGGRDRGIPRRLERARARPDRAGVEGPDLEHPPLGDGTSISTRSTSPSRRPTSRCSIDRRRIAVGGFSDGATYALTLGVSNGDLFPAVIAFSPGGIVARRAAGRAALLRLARHPGQRPPDRPRRRRRRPQAPAGGLPGHLPPLPRRPRGAAGDLEGRRPLVPRRAP